MFSFHYEGMENIIESGDHQIEVMSLRIPINLFTLAEDQNTTKNLTEKVCSHVIIYVCTP